MAAVYCRFSAMAGTRIRTAAASAAAGRYAGFFIFMQFCDNKYNDCDNNKENDNCSEIHDVSSFQCVYFWRLIVLVSLVASL